MSAMALTILMWAIAASLAVWVWFDHVEPKDRYGDRINLAWFAQRTRHFFGVWTTRDENFDGCRDAVDELGGGYETAVEVGNPMLDARLVERVEQLVAGPAIRAWQASGEKAKDEVWSQADRLLEMSPAEAARMLRLWDGCLTAAKCIADSTRSGRNWPWWRRRFAKRIDERSRADLVFARGVRAAVAFKEGRKEHWSFFGVPKDSIVRQGAR